jgi:hypothetical protein
MLCGVSPVGIVGPIFMDSTMNAERFLPNLHDMGVNMKQKLLMYPADVIHFVEGVCL